MDLEEAIGRTFFRNEKHKLMLNLLHTQSWLVQQLRAVLEPYDLDHREYRALYTLYQHNPESITSRELQYHFLDAQVNGQEVLRQLRDKGLVARSQAAGQHEEIMLTPQGRRRLEEVEHGHEKLEAILKALNEDDARIINEGLDQMRGEDEGGS